MLKILLSLVTENPSSVCCEFFFFFTVLEKLRSYCLIATSQSPKHCLAKSISNPLTFCIMTQSKCRKYVGVRWDFCQCH